MSLHQSSSINPWSLITALSLSLGLVSIPFIAPVFAQEQRIRTLTVSGQGVVTIPTTQTQVQLGVEVLGKTAEEVQTEAAKRTAAVIELLRSRNVEKLETTGIRLNPTYSYANDQQRLTGYSATNTVSFRLNTEKVGSLLDDAVKAGATRIDGISFVASDPEINAAQQQALKLATKEAESQANAVLSALNLTSREIIGIQVNNASAPVPMAVMYRTNTVAAAPATPVVGGEQEVRASVTLQISY
ncbi:SIMPL domain-containing protein [Planktothrix agardhii 1801]|uniref:SIMPL domain-containing protein n=1 Tax=Planktothrix agardhii TaxID=1160 RepID=UPI001F191CE1|nr:SIMPL domain-containing protein [Planktothrix agardhii]MCF3626194.1 SIMPL domain-containing protein [Planktothrix agardhii 1801]